MTSSISRINTRAVVLMNICMIDAAERLVLLYGTVAGDWFFACAACLAAFASLQLAFTNELLLVLDLYYVIELRTRTESSSCNSV